MPGRDIEGLSLPLHQPVKTVAADLFALEPAVGGKPRHRGAHHARINVERFEKSQQRPEPHRAAPRDDGIAEHGDDDRAGTRRFALELIDDAGKRMRHVPRIALFQDLRQYPPAGATWFETPAYALRASAGSSP